MDIHVALASGAAGLLVVELVVNRRLAECLVATDRADVGNAGVVQFCRPAMAEAGEGHDARQASMLTDLAVRPLRWVIGPALTGAVVDEAMV